MIRETRFVALRFECRPWRQLLTLNIFKTSSYGKLIYACTTENEDDNLEIRRIHFELWMQYWRGTNLQVLVGYCILLLATGRHVCSLTLKWSRGSLWTLKSVCQRENAEYPDAAVS